MDEKATDVKDWNGVELWMAELIEQKKADAERWFIAFIIAMVALVGTNTYWIYQFTSYEYVSQDGSGTNNINTGNQEDITFGSKDEG